MRRKGSRKGCFNTRVAYAATTAATALVASVVASVAVSVVAIFDVVADAASVPSSSFLCPPCYSSSSFPLPLSRLARTNSAAFAAVAAIPAFASICNGVGIGIDNVDGASGHCHRRRCRGRRCWVRCATTPSPTGTATMTMPSSRFSSFSTSLATASMDTVAAVADMDAEEIIANDVDNANDAVDVGPGAAENVKFDCLPSVWFWRDFQNDDGWTRSPRDNIQDIVDVASSFARLGPDGLKYWMQHAARSVYFATNALLGTTAFRLSERLTDDASALSSIFSRTRSSSSSSSSSSGGRGDGASGVRLPIDVNATSASRLLLEAALCYQQDYDDVRAGRYRYPWDARTAVTHRQTSPLYAARQTGRFVREAVATLRRRNRGADADRRIDLPDAAAPLEMTAAEGGDALVRYPEYYSTAFHFQTDGWMSRRSAEVYETSTETLFLGRQDAMQRLSLPPLVSLVKRLETERRSSSSSSSMRPPMRVLEVACGTGRFMTFARDNLPPDAEYTAVDLSPYYLEAARENDAYWRHQTRRESEVVAGATTTYGGTTKMAGGVRAPATFVQAMAEALPFEDGHFDAVICIYLFHELPRDVRAAAATEMARVVAPGGVVVLTDSIQKGDRPFLDGKIRNFGKMNEPYYEDYVEDNLSSHFEKNGLICGTKAVRSTTKSLSFVKPKLS